MSTKESQLEKLRAYLTNIITEKLDLEPAAIDVKTAFFSLGVTSLISEEIVFQLGQTFEDLPSTLLFEYPNVEKLSEFLMSRKRKPGARLHVSEQNVASSEPSQGELAAEPEHVAAPVTRSVSVPANESRAVDNKGYAIAVIGLSGRFPKASDPFQFWKNLVANRDCIEEIPAGRWDYLKYFSDDPKEKDTLDSKWGGFVDDIDTFDPLFFHLSHKEAELMDPQQKLFLQCGWEAMEDAGYATLSAGEKNTGVYVGVTWNEFSLYAHEAGFLKGRYTGPGSLYWGIPNRLSFFLDLTGPSLAIDTACSSSLVAIHEACQAILTGDCDMAIAGGVNLNLHPSKYIFLSQSNFLSTHGKCRSFGEGGNGYVPGEGVGAIVLKPLTRAFADGDHIYGIIRGSATNHGGKATGYTVPNPKAQQAVIRTAFERAQIVPQDLSYMECHGTGTALGDPIEIKGLSAAFQAHTSKKQFCGIGSVKSNIGHLEAAAGMVGLIKILLSMRYQTLPASLHSERLNPKIDFENSPFYVVKANQAWPPTAKKSRLAGISSFGAGGANAHLILESYAAPDQMDQMDQIDQKDERDHKRLPAVQEIFPLSAQSKPQLVQYAQKMAGFIGDVLEDPVLADQYHLSHVAHTLQSGRETFPHRLAILAASLPELQDRLIDFVRRQTASEHIHMGAAKSSGSSVGQGPSDAGTSGLKDQRALAAHWVRGDGDLPTRGNNAALSKVPLPTYPFLKEKSWISAGDVLYEGDAGKQTLLAAAEDAPLHALLDTNASTPQQGRFQKTFSKTEYFLEEHLVAGRHVIPGVCHLEIAKIGGQLWQDKPVATIKEVWFSNPIAVGGDPEVVAYEFVPKNDAVHFVIRKAGDAGGIPFSQGKIVFEDRHSEPEMSTPVNMGALRSGFQHSLGSEAVYRQFVRIGITQKYSFQVVREIHLDGQHALATIRLPAKLAKDFDRYELHPSLMDGAVQTAMIHLLHCLKREGLPEDPLIVPFHFGEVKIIKPLTPTVYAHTTLVNLSNKLLNITVYDETGQPAVEIKDFILKEYKDRKPDQEVGRNTGIYYIPTLKESPVSPADTQIPSLLIFSRDRRLADAVQQTNSARIIRVEPASAFRRVDAALFQIRPGNRADYQTLLDHLKAEGVHPEHILFMWNFDPDQEAALEAARIRKSFATGIDSVFRLTKVLLKTHQKARLLYFCGGSQAAPQPANRALGGFFRTVKLEMPAFDFKVVQCDPQTTGQEDLAQIALNELRHQGPEVEIDYQDQHRLVGGYAQAAPTEFQKPSDPLLRPSGRYLITGGMGGLGLIFARYLAQTYQADLILAGRSPLDEAKQEILKQLVQLGGQAAYLVCDIGRPDDVDRLMIQLEAASKSLNGILHSAGVIQDAFILKKDPAAFSRVITPKTSGTLLLDQATASMPLDFFVLFSSISSALGNLGQSDYAFANAFLDYFAVYREDLCKRNLRHGKTLAINWPFWKEGGMRLTPAEEKILTRTVGIEPLPSVVGLKALEDGLRFHGPQLMVMQGNDDKIRAVLGLHKREPAPAAKAVQAAKPSVAAFRPQVNGAQSHDHHQSDLNQIVEAYLTELFSRELKIPVDRIDVSESFDKYGFDSIVMINFINLMEEKFGSLPKTLFFEHKTIEEVKTYFIANHADKFASAPAAEAEATPPPAEEAAYQQPIENAIFENRPTDVEPVPRIPAPMIGPEQTQEIAIIGLAGRYPMADTLEEFWENLKAGRDCVGEIPAERWNHKAYFVEKDPQDGQSYAKWGGFINHFDRFDPLFFNISPKEARYMDPQERQFLEVAWAVIEDAGYTPVTLAPAGDSQGSPVGLFVGAMWGDYQLFGLQNAGNGLTTPQSFYWSLANRVSYTFNFSGPSMTIDTACSSSFSAIHLACESIHKGECRVAIAGAVNLSLHPNKYNLLSRLQFLSSDGRCRSFGEGGDGYVPGEGVGALLLKPLADAQADGNQIYGVIKGSRVNHGGKTSGFTVPNPAAQAALIRTALEEAQVDSRTINYLEAHGTGTALGDPIEIAGLNAAFDAKEKQYCAIGSVKSNIGHLEAASGMAGITKTLLQMKHKMLVPSLHADRLNPHINFENSPFRVQQTLTQWTPPLVEENGVKTTYPRRAGISSFGAGGANAHIILEEYETAAPATMATHPTSQLIVLSAKNEERLKVYVADMLSFLKRSFGQEKGAAPDTAQDPVDLPAQLVGAVCEILAVDPADIDAAEEFAAYGMDQVDRAALAERINAAWQLDLVADVFVEQRSIASLQAYLQKTYPDRFKPPTSAPPAPDPTAGQQDNRIALSDMAYTLQVGRVSLEERLALVVASPEELIERLTGFYEGPADDAMVLRGNVKTGSAQAERLVEGEEGREFVRRLLQKGKLTKLAQLWVAGVAIDWQLLHGGQSPRRISLPTYPFARQRYWIPAPAGTAKGAGNVVRLHALIDSNESTLEEQAFKKVFGPQVFYIKDHVVGQATLLPGVVYLEMARAAGNLATRQAPVTALQNMIWVRPMTVGQEPVQAHIHLYPQADGVEFEITSVAEDDTPVIHAQGRLAFDRHASNPAAASIDIETVKSRCTTRRSGAESYELFETLGFAYGPSLQVIREMYSSGTEALARLELPESLTADFADFGLHPALMDGALQAVMGVLEDRRPPAGTRYLPFALDAVEILSPLPQKCYAHVTLAENNSPAGSQTQRFDIRLSDESGKVGVRFNGLSVRVSRQPDQTAADPAQIDASGSLFYQSVWEKAPLDLPADANAPGPAAGPVLIMETDESLAAGPAGADQQTPIIRVKPGRSYRQVNERTYEVNPADPAHYARLMQTLKGRNLMPQRILHLWSQGQPAGLPEDLDARLETGVYALLYLSQALMAQQPKEAVKLLYVYPDRDDGPQPSDAAVAGFARTIGQENPRFVYKTVAIASAAGKGLADMLPALMQEFDDNLAADAAVRYADGQRWVKRLKPYEPANDMRSDTDSALPLKEGGVYLLTGGAGGLGLIFADYLARQKSVKLVLTGRSQLSAEKKARIQALESLGCEAVYLQADISEPRAVADLIADVKARFDHIDGVIHSAGVIRDAFILKKTHEEMRAVLAPKVHGTVHLDAALKSEALDFFVLFSSLAGVLGNLGQCDYAFANSFMDHFAHLREGLRAAGRRSGKTLAVNWPLWQAGGMQIGAPSEAWLKETFGMLPLATADGLRAFETAWKAPDPQMMVIAGQGEKIQKAIEALSSPKLPSRPEPKADPGPGMENPGLREGTQDFLKTILAHETQLPADEIDSQEPLETYGIDSVMILSLNRELENHFGALSRTLLFEYQTLAALTDYFVENHADALLAKFDTDHDIAEDSRPETAPEYTAPQVLEAKDDRSVKPADNRPAPQNGGRPRFFNSVQMPSRDRVEDPMVRPANIAIIGLAGRYPMAEDLETFWQNLKAGKDCITEIPPDRWDHRLYFDPDKDKPGKSYSKWGGFIDDVDKFDPLFFNISPREAELMDPQERLFLETVWQTLEDAGYTRQSLKNSRVGVFVGVMWGQYQLFGPQTSDDGPEVAPDSSHASIANRVSYFFDFNGPSMALDTMCSSSLSAIQLACDAIRRGDSALAIAGGVNLSIHPQKYLLLSRERFAASDGRCRSFGEGGDGYVPGEGAGAVLLKPLETATADGDHIYGVIKGVTVNHGGKTNGYTVPNPQAQAELILQTLKKAQIDPRRINYLEAHGTGTSLGDPIEITGLVKAFEQYDSQIKLERASCAIGSVKSNIGHLESAAGIAGLTKVLLQMKHHQLVPSLHAEKLNPNIRFEASPFYVQQDLTPWQPPKISANGTEKRYPRLAGISSFGAGGANAHIILEEYETTAPATRATHPTPQLIVLSAKNEERLKAYVGDMLSFLKRGFGRETGVSNDTGQDPVDLSAQLVGAVCEILAVDPADIDAAEEFAAYGLDQVDRAALADRINAAWQLDLVADVFVEQRSIASLQAYLQKTYPDRFKPPTSAPPAPDPTAGQQDNRIALSDMAYTLQVGRVSLEERLALVVASPEELIERLTGFYEGPADDAMVLRGNVKTGSAQAERLVEGEEGREFVRRLLQKGKLTKLAQLWVAGVAIDWQLLHGGQSPRRISLPTYPFARQRYWIPAPAGTAKGAGNVVRLHALIDSNESTLEEQAFKKVFGPQVFYIKDHVVGQATLLPGVVYLEMARAAGNLATRQAPVTALQNMIWVRPMTVGQEPVQAHIHLYPQADGVEFEITSVAEDDTPVIHAQGRLAFDRHASNPAAASIDIETVKSRCTTRRSGAESYELFETLGFAYGPSLQVIREMYSSGTEALARLELPESLTADFADFGLHPALMDGALQAVMGVLEDRRPPAGTRYLPFALDAVEILSPLPQKCYAHVTLAENNSPAGSQTQRFDIRLSDESGKVGVRFKGLSSRVLEKDLKAGTATTMLAPVWDAVVPEKRPIFPTTTNTIIIVGGTDKNRNRVKQLYPQVNVVGITSVDSSDAIVEKLEAVGSIDHILWIAPHDSLQSVSQQALINDQDTGVISVFRMIKALLGLGYGDRELGWSLITFQTQAVYKNDPVNPAHAAIHGLVGSMAKEYPHWKIRLVDVEKDEVPPFAEIFTLPTDSRGDALVYRDRQWHRQQLIPVREFMLQADQKLYRPEGVYVVIGGAGGIGAAWSEYMIRNYRAQIIWIGRRQRDAAIEAKLNSLAALGSPPRYISADATDKKSLKQAYDEIKKNYSQINGVIHSAIILSDQSLAKMQEEQFRASLCAKVDVSANIARIFAKESLDFVLFFSSMQTFLKAPGQSNYAAGCTFKDAFAHRLSQEWSCAVKVMNWGYWGSVGVVSSDIYKERMAKAGVGSIEAPESMAALEALLAGPFDRVALFKTTKPNVMQELSPRESIVVYPENLPSTVQIVQSRIAEDSEHEKPSVTNTAGSRLADNLFPEISHKRPVKQEENTYMRDMEKLLADLMWGQLQSIGMFREEKFTFVDLKEKYGIADHYDRWLEESISILKRSNRLRYDGKSYAVIDTTTETISNLWQRWDQQKQLWLQEPALKAQLVLVEATMRALPDILTGKTPPTDIMFPESSMALVEGIYRNNPIADYFNESLADTLVVYIQERIRNDAAVRIRILEIGAGVGSASVAVFKKLASFHKHIEQYCYTDISKAFLMHAEKEYGKKNPFLTCKIFDVEKPIAGQPIDEGGYDIVIAANVLHATKNIRLTLRNAKATLKNNGLIFLNEISDNSLFLHLTFGLLKGWWLYEDEKLRIPGCPGLSPEKWQVVLESEGFRSIFFPAKQAHDLGQQIIVAQSDGIVRQEQVKPGAASVKKSTKAHAFQEIDRKPVTITPEKEPEQGLLREKATAYIKKLIGETLKLPSHKIDSSAPLEEYGMDSILSVELTNTLRKSFDNISSTIFFEYQTIDELTEHLIITRKNTLITLLGEDSVEHSWGKDSNTETLTDSKPMVAGLKSRKSVRLSHFYDPVTKASESRAFRGQDIAIIGISGRYPQAETIQEFWHNLKVGKNCITQIPEERWDWRKYFDEKREIPGTSYTKWGGFIRDVDKFDPLFFRISPMEAESMDPQERLFLQSAYNGIEDAGYTPATLSEKRKIGVFAGVMNSDYPTGPNYSSIANRISYFMNFQGPSMAVDTACSSSLTAIHLALESLHNNTCECAIAGGVNIIVDPAHYSKLSAMTMLSASDKNKSFDAGADGFVVGEGVGVIVLKPLHKAIEDHDHIYAVIKGSMVNAGGKTNGYTVPNPIAQSKLISEALQRADIDAGTVGYIEAHGTGTSLGDPIEITGLTQAFRQFTQNRQFCAIGSVKSNIGHLEAAAGIAGVTKIILQMQNKKLVPSLHCDELNPKIDFESSPFVVQQKLADWKRPIIEGKKIPRRAGISSFGAGGANAHLIIEEYERKQPESESRKSALGNQPQIVVLSAQNEDRLKAQAKRLLAEIQTRRFSDKDLADIAYTLQVGREAQEARLAMVVTDMAELMERLTQYAAGQTDISHFYQGNAAANRGTYDLMMAGPTGAEFLKTLIQNRELDRLAKLWVSGVAIDWQLLYAAPTPRRISLPTYPFARERYWVPQQQADVPVLQNGNGRADKLHPLIDRNISTLREEKFIARVTGREFYVADHVVNGAKILPGVAYLEMARAAGMIAAESPVVSIQNSFWAQPVAVADAPAEVQVRLHPAAEAVDYEISSLGIDGRPVIHAQGRLAFDGHGPAPDSVQVLDVEAIKSRCTAHHSRTDSYRLFKTWGFTYGPRLQAIEELFTNGTEALARLELPESLTADFADFGLHPALMDGALQTVMGLMQDSPTAARERYLPFALDAVDILRPLPTKGYTHVTQSKNGDGDGAQGAKFDIALADESGQVCVQMKDLSLRALRPADTAAIPSGPAIQPPATHQKEGPSHYYQSVWEEAALPSQGVDLNPVVAPETGDPSGPLLIFETDNRLSQALPAVADTAPVMVVQPGESFRDLGDRAYTVHPGRPEDYQRLAQALAERDLIPARIVHNWSQTPFSTTADDLASQLERGIYSVLYLSQALMTQKPQKPVRLVYVFPENDGAPQPQYAAVGAFARTIRKENPRFVYKTLALGHSLDTRGNGSAAALSERVMAEFSPRLDAHVEIRYADGGRWVKQLKKLAPVPGGHETLPLKENGVYLLTGGAGGLGLIFAEYLARQQSVKLVLTGRSELSPPQKAALQALASHAAEAVYIRADVSDRQAVKDLISDVKSRFKTINGIVHSAGVTRDAFILKKTSAEMDAVLAPKVYGTVHLDEALQGESLDFFVMFSSITAMLGNVGQGDYAFANSFMDHFAARREQLHEAGRRSGKTLSINWPLWKEGGMQI